MNTNESRTVSALMIRPFVYIAGAKALLIGLGAIILAALVGALGNTHFDGVLDTHTGAGGPVWLFVSEGIIDWLCLSLVLLIAGRIFSKSAFRTIDLLGTQALARWPTILVSLIFLPGAIRRFSSYLVEQMRAGGGGMQLNGPDAVIFFAAIIAMIPLLCWMVYLMYKAYSISCNLTGGKGIGTFTVGLIVAEIISKFAIYGVLKLARL